MHLYIIGLLTTLVIVLHLANKELIRRISDLEYENDLLVFAIKDREERG
jgi:hypothetical protein